MTGTPRAVAGGPLVRALRDEEGFSLAEMLVVIVILGLMMAAVFGTLDVSQKAYSRASASEDAQAGLRSAMDRIVSDFRLIGSFYTGSGNAGGPITTFGPVVSSALDCSSACSITFLGDVDADTATTTISSGTVTVTEAVLAADVAAGATSITVTPSSGTSGTLGFTATERLYIASGSVREVATVSALTAPSTLTVSALMNGYPAGSLIRSVEQVTYTYTAGTGSALGTLTRTSASEPSSTLLDNVASFSMTGYDFAGSTTTNVAGMEELEVNVRARTSGGPTGSATRAMKIRVRLRVVPSS